MTEQENILRLAREAGFGGYAYEAVSLFERFYALVKADAVAETREEFAFLCDELAKREIDDAAKNNGRGSDIAFGRMAAAEELSSQVRSLKEKHTQERQS